MLPPWLEARRKRVDARNARRLSRGMLRLRGVFIKLGQVLSIMGGFLPRVYAKELEQLQDQVPPQPFSAARGRACARASASGPTSSSRASSASRSPPRRSARCTSRTSHDGRKVAVKFLYPGIRGDHRRRHARPRGSRSRVYKRFVPVAKIERVHESLVDLLRRETDYLHEAACMERMAKNFAGDAGPRLPRARSHELTTQATCSP